MKTTKLAVIILVMGVCFFGQSLVAFGCSGILVGKNASDDGSTMISMCQDHVTLDPHIHYIPAKDHKPGTMKQLPDYPQEYRYFDPYGKPVDGDHKYTGAVIPEVPHTYGYMRATFGVINEHQVSIGQSTMNGTRKELENDQTKLRATILSFMAMERAKTAREAIKIVTSLAEKFGFKGEFDPGKCLNIADPNEVWMLGLMPPGPLWTPDSGKPGCIWVAQRVPDDHAAVYPNGHHIHEINLDKPDYFMASSNIFSTAKEMGWWDPASGVPFNVAEVYQGKQPFGVNTRKWRGLKLLAPSLNIPEPEKIKHLKGAHKGWSYRYPSTIKPDKKISVADMMRFQRDRFEGTKYDLTKGPLAGPFGAPTRTMGTSFKVDGKTVLSVRTPDDDATQFSFVCQMRSWMPDPIGGIVWWAPGRAKTSFYVPFYCGITRLSDNYTTPNYFKWEWGKTAFWAACFTNTFAHTLWSYIIEDVKQKQSEIEGDAFASIPAIDKAALELHKSDPQKARAFLTQWSNQFADDATKRYWDFANYLVVRYYNRWVNKHPYVHVQRPKMPDAEYWLKQELEYQENVRGIKY